MDQRRAGKPAPYGQACLECFKAKCKCILRADPSRCARCHRLDQPCTSSVMIRRRRRQDGHTATSTLARMEKRFDGITAMSLTGNCESSARQQYSDSAVHVQTALQPSPPDTPPESVETGPINHVDMQRLAQQDVTHDCWLVDAVGAIPPPIADKPVAATQTPQPAHISPLHVTQPDKPNYTVYKNPLHISLFEKQASTIIFRDKMLPWCPFVYLPQDTTGETTFDSTTTVLNKDKPFFLLAISTITATSRRLRNARIKEMNNILLHEIITDTHPTIDLVLAVLTLVAWKFERSFSRHAPSKLLALIGPAMHGFCLDISKKIKDRAGCVGDRYSQARQDLDGLDSAQGDISDLLEKCRAVLGHYILNTS
ncbi:hypothetical protein BD289DRAFT_265099 [Coniella lustricola]|uniref:Zn(2)-C6 fungal-type domain-containing protein n=1 Tax=Coniella lustricola TaxID=2025994 RepID=A0A2T3A7F5_9PEZI|nr:hypothetical protein BD289DRAFT_265099 [Coniella lustricola]